MDLSVSTDWSYCGLSAVVLENRRLRVVILPDAGGKIWQITHKPTDTDLLWNNPRMPPARLPMNSRYDDVWSGGWDELFPNDEAATLDGSVFVVCDGERMIAATTTPEPTVGLVFYDLKTCLRSVDEPKKKPAPRKRAPAKKEADDAAS